MHSPSRRQLLQLSAGTMAAASLDALPAALRQALAHPASGRGDISDVEHVIIFMQENRSFDHYFGTLRGVRGFGDPHPLRLPSGKAVWFQPRVANGDDCVRPFHLDEKVSRAQCMDSLDHSWKGVRALWQHHDFWAWRKTPLSMGHFTRADLPFYHALADAFTICDSYHSSLFGPTDPNRLFLFSGTNGLSVGANGLQAAWNIDDANETADMRNDNPLWPGLGWRTYAERLEQAGISWQVYQEYNNYGDNALAHFSAFRGLDPASSLYRRGRAWVPGSNRANADSSDGRYLVEAFGADIASGRLPQVSWIVAPRHLSEHPSSSPAAGEDLCSRLLTALASHPETWSRSVFLLTYDENDGFFDHVLPPQPPVERSQGLSSVDTSGETYLGTPVGLGIRVPMLVISPWSRGGWVCSQLFDHTSVLRFLEKRFGVPEPNISQWRRAVTGDLTSAFDFGAARPDWPARLPDTSQDWIRAREGCQLPPPAPPDSQGPTAQEAGVRPARALPYRLQVDGRCNSADGRFWLDFINTGRAGVALTVNAGNRLDGPWYYTLTVGARLSDYWSAARYTRGEYDFEVYGPNGFYRAMRGRLPPAGSALEVRAWDASTSGDLIVELHNMEASALTCTLQSVGDASRTLRLAAGEIRCEQLVLQNRASWYDVRITVSSDAHYWRRIAGHVETGRSGYSDPALGIAS
ncbi:phosphocholine-specific phospholipase C [Paludibacterium yongneupense]|uniref:phosphocholine-specific phospholipase C n=1 Tax=Paludibacterium yongneupense TaxID=400061 RepID=UPI00042A4C22|nr:phospholipase C, phosphocholine-specific [Paludibacterium yongneupense]